MSGFARIDSTAKSQKAHRGDAGSAEKRGDFLLNSSAFPPRTPRLLSNLRIVSEFCHPCGKLPLGKNQAIDLTRRSAVESSFLQRTHEFNLRSSSHLLRVFVSLWFSLQTLDSLGDGVDQCFQAAGGKDGWLLLVQPQPVAIPGQQIGDVHIAGEGRNEDCPVWEAVT